MTDDYAGLTLPLTDRRVPPGCGEIHPVQVFVATLGASSHTFVDATLTQSIPDWIGSHKRAFAFFGGVTELIVCDNLRSGVTTPCRYEPVVCHNKGTASGGLNLVAAPFRTSDPTSFGLWVKVYDHVSVGEMPPKGSHQPVAASKSQFLTALRKCFYLGLRRESATFL